MTVQHHDPLAQTEDVPRASNRSVGLVLGVVFGVIGAWPLLSDGGVRLWALIIACILIGCALVLPRTLAPVAWAWLGLGQVLHHVVSPVILGGVYALAVIPTGLYLKATGKDPLRLKREPESESYWIPRDPPGPDPTSLPQQF